MRRECLHLGMIEMGTSLDDHTEIDLWPYLSPSQFAVHAMRLHRHSQSRAEVFTCASAFTWSGTMGEAPIIANAFSRGRTQMLCSLLNGVDILGYCGLSKPPSSRQPASDVDRRGRRLL